MLQKHAVRKTKTAREEKRRMALVVSLFNRRFTRSLEKHCIKTLLSQGIKKKYIDVIHVPGSFEIPLFCQKLAQTKNYDALIALGVIIKGDTHHFELVASECARGVMDVMLRHEVPIIFEVLAGEKEDMEKRCGDDEYNKGIEAANAALQLLAIGRKL